MSLNVAITGATSLLGKEVLAVLNGGPLALGDVRPLDALSSETTHVPYGDRMLPVGLLDADALDGVDLVFACARMDGDEALLAEAADAGVLIADLAGIRVLDPRTPVASLPLRLPELDGVRTAGAFTVPSAAALVISAVASALRPHQLLGVRGTVVESASVAGEAGVRELSGQVAALFNSQDPPRAVFEHGLAFDLIPQWGAALSSGWTADELILAGHAGRALELPPEHINVDRIVAPMFVGLGASLQILLGHPVAPQDALDAFKAYPNLAAGVPKSAMPRTRMTSGEIAVSRVRTDRAGGGLHLWAAADPVRLRAGTAVGTVGVLLEQGLL